MIKVGIIADRIEARAARQGWRGCGFGGTGYTGVELLRLLAQHPRVEPRVITSRGEAGKPVADLFPNLRGHLGLAFSEPGAKFVAAYQYREGIAEYCYYKSHE